MRVLVTGGAGYIGSHACIAFIEAGHELVVIDDFSNSDPGSLEVVIELTGGKLNCIESDVRDRFRIRRAMAQEGFDAVLHLAAMKSVPKSIRCPEQYEDVNVRGTSVVLEEAVSAGIGNFVFCSSAAVYGAQRFARVSETDTPNPSTPYARTKLAGEQMLQDVARSRRNIHTCSLRCFNPIGAHSSGSVGGRAREQPLDLLSNILIARRDNSAVEIFGVDYDTPDRSAIRDFVHVMDIAEGCLAAVTLLARAGTNDDNACTFNLGTGRGISVLHLIRVVEKVGARPILRRQNARRAGDISVSVADPTLCATTLKWEARRSLEEACADALRSFEREVLR